MPKINVYLPAELADAVRDADLPLSAICQRALENALLETTSLARLTAGADDLRRYTERSRRVVSLASEYARDAGKKVSSTFVLLALAAEGDGVAAIALQRLGVAADELKQQMPDAAGDDTLMEEVARRAEREALKLGHHYVGTEHLLLGISRGTAATAMLRQRGVAPSAVRRAVFDILSSAHADRAGSADNATVESQLADLRARLTKLERRR
jgi:ATP-dependent Clp protease ATP-binding subunit ClpC